MQNRSNYGTAVNLTIRKRRKHVNLNRKATHAHYKAACFDEVLWTLGTTRQVLCIFLLCVLACLRASTHELPSLTLSPFELAELPSLNFLVQTAKKYSP